MLTFWALGQQEQVSESSDEAVRANTFSRSRNVGCKSSISTYSIARTEDMQLSKRQHYNPVSQIRNASPYLALSITWDPLNQHGRDESGYR